jgi:hypothetical protein
MHHLEMQGTVKELRAQLAALGLAQKRRRAARAAASVGSVACLATAYLWRVYDLGAAGPVKIVLALLLLGCTLVIVRQVRQTEIEPASLAQISSLLGGLRATVKGHGPLSVRANFVTASGPHGDRADQDWLTILFPMQDGEVELNARCSVTPQVRFTFRSRDPVRVSGLKNAIDSSPHPDTSSNEARDGALRTCLQGKPAALKSRTEVADLPGWVEWYLQALQAT